LRSTIQQHRWLALVAGLAVLAISMSAATPAGAASGGGKAVIADCYAHLSLTRTYSLSALEDALRTMPADVAEYSDCHDVITRALLAEQAKLHRSGSASGGSSSGGSFLPTPLIVVLVVLALAAATLGGLALRRRRTV
jgi:hypothetical protein